MPWQTRPKSEQSGSSPNRKGGIYNTNPIWIDPKLKAYYQNFLTGKIEIPGLKCEFKFNKTKRRQGIHAGKWEPGVFMRRESVSEPTLDDIKRVR